MPWTSASLLPQVYFHFVFLGGKNFFANEGLIEVLILIHD